MILHKFNIKQNVFPTLSRTLVSTQNMTETAFAHCIWTLHYIANSNRNSHGDYLFSTLNVDILNWIALRTSKSIKTIIRYVANLSVHGKHGKQCHSWTGFKGFKMDRRAFWRREAFSPKHCKSCPLPSHNRVRGKNQDCLIFWNNEMLTLFIFFCGEL